ncbi:preprotein translocase subunit SecA [Candidatus Azambacteria bacterium]|nr:preprotein translocase subunit SecA [Candidatus Azambacteria bacterium]
MSILSKIFGDANERYLNKIKPLLKEVNSFDGQFLKLSDSDLKNKTEEFKNRFLKGASLDEILPETFAIAREAAKRTLNQRHFDEQILGAIALHQGKIAQMATGEGKTLTATLPAYLNAIPHSAGDNKASVHIITVNDYLARRDAVWMGQIYDFLGLTVGCINSDGSYIYDPLHGSNLKSQISNLKNNEQKLDELRDNQGSFRVVHEFLRPASKKDAYNCDIVYGTNTEFGFDYLRDNLVGDLSQIISPGRAFAIVDEVDSILIDEARTPLIISMPDAQSPKLYETFSKIVPQLKENEDYNVDLKMRTAIITDAGLNKVEKILGMENIYEERSIRYVHHLEQALRAEALFHKDKDYVVRNGEIIIVDEFTGRLLQGRRYSEGLHQAIEAKEGVKVQQESKTLATITFQNFFRLYDKLAGMTGTAATSAEEFHKVYNLGVVIAPTHKPMIRKNLADKIYKTKEAKFKAVVDEVKERNAKGQPVLIGTISIENNEMLSRMLSREGIKHEVLNAKQHEREAAIHAQAGRLGAVTVATNMAGRGVDIILGGNPKNPEEAKQVADLGGLCVIGTERHEARRIDDQLRGRAGRQGDPGSSQFFVSLEDSLLKIFGGERIKNLMTTLNIPEDQPIEAGLVSKAIESAQTKIEGFNFDARKHILEYDDVMNQHRSLIYKKRREILSGVSRDEVLELLKNQNMENAEDLYDKKEKEIGPELMRQVEKMLMLNILDNLWMNHLEDMEYLRDSVRLRAYGQRDPLVEYKNESKRLFKDLLFNFDAQIASLILKIQPPAQSAISDKRQATVTDSMSHVSNQHVAGRNDPCPCGSGKKYKRCCGA